MGAFRFFHPVEVRYGDIDPQRHVNNARFFTYMEQARVEYFQHLGLWNGRDFDAVGFILAEQSCSYKAPILLGQPIEVGVRAVRLGEKSFELTYLIRDQETRQELATGRTILVAYDYRRSQSRPIPKAWKRTILAFEGMAATDSQ
jgi:acyl-CoA thioester hydrolase